MSREDWFEWNGARSTAYGIYVDTQPPITMPVERVTKVTVPGRPGTLTKKEGEDVYDDLVLSALCVMKDGTRLPEIMKWLKGSGKVTFANRPGGYYNARVSNQIPFDKVLRGRDNRTFTIVFRCGPFWNVSDEKEIALTAPGSVTNEGSVYAEPVITVIGTGDCELLVGSTVIELTGLTGSITIDSGLQEAYDGLEDMNDCMSGDFPRLSPGKNGISWEGEGVTEVRIKMNTRYL